MDDDFLVVLWILSMALAIISVFALVAAESDEPDRIDNICESLKADRVEDTCIRNGTVVFQD